MHTVNHAFFKALLFLGAGINVPALNPAIFWELLYQIITILLNTGQSEGNLLYKILEILRDHTQEVINIKSFCLNYKISSSIIFCSSKIFINKLKFSSLVEPNLNNIN